MEKRAETIARLRALLARPDKIWADMQNFDGDKRGHYDALDEACEELSREAVNALPGILDALEAAQKRYDRLRVTLEVIDKDLARQGHEPESLARSHICSALEYKG